MKDEVIILVPGWSCPKSYEWDISPFEKWFKSEGYKVIKFRQVENGMCSIDDNAAILSHLVEKEALKAPVHVIGHSMGGLTARKAARYFHAPMASLTTIGTPHKGTQLARAGFWSQSARQMVPGSKWLTELEKIESFYSHTWPKSLNVACRWDEIVPPNSFMEGAEQRVVDHTHMSVIFSKKTFLIIESFLRKGYN